MLNLVLAITSLFSAQFVFDSRIVVDSSTSYIYSGKVGNKYELIELFDMENSRNPTGSGLGTMSESLQFPSEQIKRTINIIDSSFVIDRTGIVGEMQDSRMKFPGVKMDSLFVGKLSSSNKRLDGMWRSGSTRASNREDSAHFTLLATRVKISYIREPRRLCLHDGSDSVLNSGLSFCDRSMSRTSYEYIRFVDKHFSSVNKLLIPDFDGRIERDVVHEVCILSRINDSTIKITYKDFKSRTVPGEIDEETQAFPYDPNQEYVLTYKAKYVLWRAGQAFVYSFRDLMNENAVCKERIDSIRVAKGPRFYVYDLNDEGLDVSYLGEYPQLPGTIPDGKIWMICGFKKILGL